MIISDNTREAVFLKNEKLNTIILLPDALSSRVCSIIYLFSVKYRLHSYSLLMHKLWNRKEITISECSLIDGETENLSWTKKPPTRFVIETFQLITLAVCCGYGSNLIGRRTINIPELILGVHGLTGFTVNDVSCSSGNGPKFIFFLIGRFKLYAQ